jgi:hypothetical protein
MRAAVGSSLSYSSEDDSVSPSDFSASSNATGFYAWSVCALQRPAPPRTSARFTPPPNCFLMGRASSSSSSEVSCASISAKPACLTCKDSSRLPSRGSLKLSTHFVSPECCAALSRASCRFFSSATSAVCRISWSGVPGVPGAEPPLDRRTFFDGGPLGVEGDEAVDFAAERCMNCCVLAIEVRAQ